MADRPEHDRALDGVLAGWGTPEPRADFVDRVCARIEGDAGARGTVGRPRRWLLSFALGGVVGGLVVAAVVSRGVSSPAPRGADAQRRIHLQAPGVADVVGEPGAQLYWQRRGDGRVVLELHEGLAWVRRTDGAELGLIAGDAETVLRGTCVRVEVVRGLLSVDANIDDVECGRVAEMIEQVRAELSHGGSR